VKPGQSFERCDYLSARLTTCINSAILRRWVLPERKSDVVQRLRGDGRRRRRHRHGAADVAIESGQSWIEPSITLT
jgi:hypothetical protein